MLNEIIVDLDRLLVQVAAVADGTLTGKALAVSRILEAEVPEKTLYLTGYTPLAAAGLGFAGKLNLYGVSLLGNNLQGSRSGGIIATCLTRLGIVGIKITGMAQEQQVLVIQKDGTARLLPLSTYGEGISGTFELARRLYGRHGDGIGLAVTDPMSTGFSYNAVVCNA
ncbi:MAG: aldehyde ferredoxin oxidoreductase N-terminal domain-containing protein, partial [bacterium]